eukprot:3296608-Rhodomonas_salina.5
MTKRFCASPHTTSSLVKPVEDEQKIRACKVCEWSFRAQNSSVNVSDGNSFIWPICALSAVLPPGNSSDLNTAPGGPSVLSVSLDSILNRRIMGTSYDQPCVVDPALEPAVKEIFRVPRIPIDGKQRTLVSDSHAER